MDPIRPIHEIAIDFLRLKAHRVGEFSRNTHECEFDDITVSDLGLIALAQTYREEWVEYFEKTRFAETMAQAPAHRHCAA